MKFPIPGLGYNDRANVLYGVQKELVGAPDGQGVEIPWGKNKNFCLNDAGRAMAALAIEKGALGVASKIKGKDAWGEDDVKVRYYYGINNGGNWFAEMWPAWKCILVLTPLMGPLCSGSGIMSSIRSGFNYLRAGDVDVQAGWPLYLLVMGIVMLLCFLPRYLYSARRHLLVMYSIGSEFPAMTYGASRLLYLTGSVVGAAAIWTSFESMDMWSVSATVKLITYKLWVYSHWWERTLKDLAMFWGGVYAWHFVMWMASSFTWAARYVMSDVEATIIPNSFIGRHIADTPIGSASGLVSILLLIFPLMHTLLLYLMFTDLL